MKKEDTLKIKEVKTCPDCSSKINPLRSGGLDFYCIQCQHDSVETKTPPHRLSSSYFPEHVIKRSSWNNKGGKPNIDINKIQKNNNRDKEK